MTVQTFAPVGTMLNPITGEPLTGYIQIVPSNELVDTVSEVVYPAIGYQIPVVGGVVNPSEVFNKVPFTDNPDLSPSGWTLIFTERFAGVSQNSYSAFVPADMAVDGAVDMSDLVKLASPPAVVQYVISGQPLTITGSGDAGQVLTLTSPTEASWQDSQGGGGGGAVTTVFGRSGAVVAVSGDYSIGQISGAGSAAGMSATAFDAAGQATAALGTANSFTTSSIAALSLGTKSKQNAGTITGLLAEVLPIFNFGTSGGSTLTAGFQIANLIRPDGPITVTNLGIWITLAGVTSSGYNGLGLFTEAGVLIDQTADMSAQFATLGYVEAPLSLGTFNTTANTSYYISVISHFSGTVPKAASSLAGLAIPSIKGHLPSISKSGVATFPANFTPSSYSTSTAGYYMGMS